MATFELPITSNLIPDASGRATVSNYSRFSVNKLFNHLVYVLEDPASSQEHGFYGTFIVPQNYVGTPVIRIYWTTSATTGSAVFEFRHRAVASGESMDQSTFSETPSVTASSPATAHTLSISDISLTAALLSAGKIDEFYFLRRDAAGADTIAAQVVVHEIVFRYSDA